MREKIRDPSLAQDANLIMLITPLGHFDPEKIETALQNARGKITQR